MLGIVGIITVFGMIVGGFLLSGGDLKIVIKALPFEMMIIGGAGVGAFLVSNEMAAVKQTLKDLGRIFKGPKWKEADYRDLMCLMFELIKLARKNPVAIEEHIESPEHSRIFLRYPQILADKEAVALIADTMRSASMNYDDPHQVEEVLEKRIDAHIAEMSHSSHALQTMADGLPALGIVAAVLGVIKTMGSIDQPPEILGKMIGSALVGTFLGVLLAYGVVGPFAAKIKATVEEDAHFYRLIREVLVANLHQHSPNICIEVGRQNTPAHNRPNFSELEEAIKALKKEAA
ncbi:flagellar motor stator protein MotA [Shimia haliotis]|uniref:Chemotaxis protein MotA n=1 Tax=Shimia haliotis TaxID=1280847 RepID=A0A1I4DBL8_9RHOB|nr:flagellar motor stator protein MotA [Shimia haliotis]SFK91194.1 chemotaxis protein MotA [Shimia haliotis]